MLHNTLNCKIFYSHFKIFSVRLIYWHKPYYFFLMFPKNVTVQ
nr:MAG TPA: hypothetical protein [Caudoviricetes sp.]